MKEKTSILLLTCNRKDFSKQTIDGLYERLINPEKFLHLIVVDNNSNDGTVEMLRQYEKDKKIHKLILLDKDHTTNIAGAYNMAFKYVESENDYVITMQDDIVIPKLDPDVIEQLICLMGKYSEQGTIASRIQHIPNIKWLDGDLTPARKAISAYCRIQRISDMKKLGENPFGTRDWDDLGMRAQMDKLGKKSSWANNLYCNHLGHCKNRGYGDYKRMWGWDNDHKKDPTRKPYPEIDKITNRPLAGQKIYK